MVIFAIDFPTLHALFFSGLLRTVPTASNISQLRLTRPTQSPTIWYSKFSSLPGKMSSCIVAVDVLEDFV